MKHLFCLFTIALLFGCTGCLENAMLLKVNTDGSGEITYRLFLSEPMLQAMTAAGNETDTNGSPAATDPNAALQVMLQHLQGEFGTEVTLASSKITKNKRGWQGFEAVYAFPDINKIRLEDIDPTGRGSTANHQSGASLGGRYTFEFTPGNEAELRLIPIPDSVSGSPYGDDPDGPQDWNSLLGTDLTDDLFTRVEGLRITLYLILAGEIIESNAEFPSRKHPNVITLLDLPFDHILANTEAQETIKATGPNIRQVLDAVDVKGVRIEDAGKEISIRFK